MYKFGDLLVEEIDQLRGYTDYDAYISNKIHFWTGYIHKRSKISHNLEQKRTIFLYGYLINLRTKCKISS